MAGMVFTVSVSTEQHSAGESVTGSRNYPKVVPNGGWGRDRALGLFDLPFYNERVGAICWHYLTPSWLAPSLPLSLYKALYAFLPVWAKESVTTKTHRKRTD